ncbi:CBS domain-containing protein [soil metagenome]
MSVAQILNAKGTAVMTAAPTDTVANVATTLARKRIGSIVIVGPTGSIEGIVSERDVVRAIASDGGDALSWPVMKIMTGQVKTCGPNDTEAELMALMTEHRIRHLPVVQDGKLNGIISIGDVVKFRIEAIEREAAEMKSYISSAG